MQNQENNIVKLINAEHIIDPPNPNRSEISQEELQWLADSIARDGLINPITVRPIGDKYEVVAGHRRFRACLLARKINIECFVKTLTDAEAEDIKANENLYRQDLNPMEEAIALHRLIGEDETKIPNVAERWGKTEAWVRERLGILMYPEYFFGPLEAGIVGLGVAKALAQVEDEDYRRMWFDQAVRDSMTTWQAEYYLHQWQSGIFKSVSEVPAPTDADHVSEAAPIKMQCAACQKMAIAPNLQTVWVHIECPADKIT